jgi:hypothetical protein
MPKLAEKDRSAKYVAGLLKEARSEDGLEISGSVDFCESIPK